MDQVKLKVVKGGDAPLLNARFWQQIVAMLVGVSVTGLAAQVRVPFYPVPFTLQTVPVLLCGLIFGWRLAAKIQISYLIAGATGIPVFAGLSGGVAVMAGPTGGYLVGFVAAAALIGFLTERGWDRSPLRLICSLLLGNALILGLGWAYLSLIVGPNRAFMGGVIPFIGGDLLKIAIVSTSALGISEIRRRFSSSGK